MIHDDVNVRTKNKKETNFHAEICYNVHVTYWYFILKKKPLGICDIFFTPQNLQYARDLLLGNPQWQSLSYMPAQGLFSERKSANFFQVGN